MLPSFSSFWIWENGDKFNFNKFGVCLSTFSKGVSEESLFLIIHASWSLVDAALSGAALILLLCSIAKSVQHVLLEILFLITTLDTGFKQTPNCLKLNFQSFYNIIYIIVFEVYQNRENFVDILGFKVHSCNGYGGIGYWVA